MWGWKRIVLLVAGLVAAAALFAFFWIGPRFVIGILTYGRQAREGSLRIGDPAPSVTLIDPGSSARRDLAEWIGPRPLVLVFGSFT